MNLTQLIILWLTASGCWANIFEVTPKISEPTSLGEATVKILSCYENDVGTVGLAGSLEGIPYKTLCSEQFMLVTLVGNDTIDAPVDRELRQKLQLFVVAASSSTKLQNTLNQVKWSRWWNHMATFLILDWSSSKDHGCSNAFPYLWTAWDKNLLNALYVCLHRRKGRLVYSFNPYTSYAPKPWQWENTFRGKDDHPWTLLWRNYDDDEGICLNLKFDKTTDLGGYKIYGSVKGDLLDWIVDHKTGVVDLFDGREGFLEAAIFQALNATPHLIVHDKQIPGMNDELGNDMAMDTVNGISDVLLHARIYQIVQNYTLCRVFMESELGILTQISGDESQLAKLLKVLDRSTRYCLCLVIVITVFFFKFFLSQHIGSAILNVIRISTNSTLTRVPNNQAARLYLAGVFFLVVTVIGIYQGKLASLLTKSKKMPNVESIEDLADPSYTIHGHKTYAYLFDDPVFKGRFIKHEDYDCEKYVVHDSSAACVQDIDALILAASKLKLHISRNPVMKTQGVYVIREDWPLEERFNAVLEAFDESDVVQHTVMAQSLRTLSITKFHETEDKKEKFKVMVLRELAFAFCILGIGLGCATVCFVVEIVVRRPCYKKPD